MYYAHPYATHTSLKCISPSLLSAKYLPNTIETEVALLKMIPTATMMKDMLKCAELVCPLGHATQHPHKLQYALL